MRLHIREQVFSFGGAYDITNDDDVPVYYVEARPFAFGKTLDVMDQSGGCIATIHHKLFTLAQTYEILQNEQVIAVVEKEIFTFLNPRFTVEGEKGVYEMSGDWLNWEYEIYGNGQIAGQVTKEFALFQDRYVLDVADGADASFLICLTIIMDEVTRHQ